MLNGEKKPRFRAAFHFVFDLGKGHPIYNL